jgi:plastocyanin
MSARMRTRFLFGAAAAVVVLVAGATGASGAPGPPARAVTGLTAKYYGYLTPVLVISKGGSLTYTNLDIERHNVVQDVKTDGVHGPSTAAWCAQFPKGRCPIFYSALIGFGGSEAVKGLQNVTPGKIYTFYCTLHPGMKGRLVVQP